MGLYVSRDRKMSLLLLKNMTLWEFREQTKYLPDTFILLCNEDSYTPFKWAEISIAGNTIFFE